MSRFRRRLMGLAALRQAFADDFVRVEYIQNPSKAYINTLYRPSNNTSVEVKLKYIENLVQWKFVYGVEQPTYRFSFLKTKAGLPFRFDFGTTINAFDYELVLNQLLTIKQDRNKLYIDDILIGESTYTSTFRTPYNLYIFTCNKKGKVDDVYNNQQIRLYGFKIWENDKLVRDYIPMYQISTDTYGLWDRVEKKFYTSPNGVKFTGGARVVADADDNLYYIKNYIYINSKQQQYIILKPFTENDNVELKVHPIGATNYWFGDRTAGVARRRLQIASWNNTRLDIVRNQFSYIDYPKGIINKDITLKLDGKQFYVNNELLYTFTSTLSTTNNTNLGRVYNTGRPTNSRFYWFKWWNKNKDLIYDLIPVQRCSDGVWGFFDKVSLVFHPSNGTEQFTGG